MAAREALWAIDREAPNCELVMGLKGRAEVSFLPSPEPGAGLWLAPWVGLASSLEMKSFFTQSFDAEMLSSCRGAAAAVLGR